MRLGQGGGAPKPLICLGQIDGMDLMARWVPIVSAGFALDLLAGITIRTSEVSDPEIAGAVMAANGEIVGSIVARVRWL